LKNIFVAADTRQKQAKKRSLCAINEHFEPIFNTVAATQIVFQRPVRVIAPGIAHTDKIAKVQTILQEIVALTRLKAGCLCYQPLKNNRITFCNTPYTTGFDKNNTVTSNNTPYKEIQSLI